MRGQEPLDQQTVSPFTSGPERTPDGTGVMLAVLVGTLCWAVLLALFL